MKKNIIIFILGMAAVAAIFYIVLQTDRDLDQSKRSRIIPVQENTEKQTTALGEEIITEQVEKLAKELEVSVSKRDTFIKLNDYRITPKKFLKSQNSPDLIKYLKGTAKDLNKCLKEDFCGTRPDADGYFDANQTPGHKLLARTLEILNESDTKELDEIEFLDLLDHNNEKILSNATELFSKSNPTDEELKSFLEKSRTLGENYKTEVFYTLLSNSSKMNRSMIIEELALQLKSADPYSIVSFFQKLEKLDVNQSEIELITKSGCHLKDSEIAWNSFSHNFKKYTKKNSISLTIEEVCP
jgi:hypothetical protein